MSTRKGYDTPAQIESYRRDIAQREGRQLTVEEAAMEWISRYASSFPNP